jgi:hypothetical protein
MLATILAASIVVMALPLESAEASRERKRESRGGDAVTGDFESGGDGNEGNFAEGDNAISGAATGGSDNLHQSNKNTGYLDV